MNKKQEEGRHRPLLLPPSVFWGAPQQLLYDPAFHSVNSVRLCPVRACFLGLAHTASSPCPFGFRQWKALFLQSQQT